MIAAPSIEHSKWNSSVIACVSFNVLAVLQCTRDVFLVFVYSNQKGSLVSHCELWVTCLRAGQIWSFASQSAEIVQNAGLFLIYILSIFLFLLACTVCLQPWFINYTFGLIMWLNEQSREDKMQKDWTRRLWSHTFKFFKILMILKWKYQCHAGKGQSHSSVHKCLKRGSLWNVDVHFTTYFHFSSNVPLIILFFFFFDWKMENV